MLLYRSRGDLEKVCPHLEHRGVLSGKRLTLIRKYFFTPQYNEPRDENDTASEASCPIFSIPWDREAERELNNIVACRVPDLDDLTDAGPEEPEDRGVGAWWKTNSYSIDYFDKSWLSLLFHYHNYYGGVHGMNKSRSLNLKLLPGKTKIIRNDEFFRKELDWVSRIIPYCTKIIFKRKIEIGWGVSDLNISKSDIKIISITEKGLKFTFEPYICGCYAEGYYDAIIPFLDISDIISDDIYSYFVRK